KSEAGTVACSAKTAAKRCWTFASQRWAGPLKPAIDHSESRTTGSTAARAPSMCAVRAVRRRANSEVPSEGFNSRVVAENWLSRLSKEPSRSEDTSRVGRNARMEVEGLRASAAQ